MGRVVIGMDPHKRSATIEVLPELVHPAALDRREGEPLELPCAVGQRRLTGVAQGTVDELALEPQHAAQSVHPHLVPVPAQRVEEVHRRADDAAVAGLA